MTLVAIHQPNFFPWLGFLAKLQQADIFVVLNHVFFPKTSRGTWMNRVQIRMGDRARWITVPLNRKFDEKTPIHNIQIQDYAWKKRMLAQLFHSYANTAHFEDVYGWLENLFSNEEIYLEKWNYYLLGHTLQKLGLKNNHLQFSSQLNVHTSKTQLLVDIVKQVGASGYLCGGGSEGYLKASLFAESDIELVYQNFKHPVYSQTGNQFISGLSVLDAIFNLGFSQTGELIRSLVS